MDEFPHWVDHILAFILCIALPFYGAITKRSGFSNVSFNSEQKKGFYISASLSLLIMGAVVILVWLVFKRPIAEIGLTQPRNFQGWWWIIIAFVSIYVLDTAIPLSSKKGIEEAVNDFRNRTPFLPTRKRELPEYILMCFSAGVFEEIVYRGYLVTYCWYLFAGMDNRELLAVGLPAFAFAVAHYYQGAKAVLKIIVLAGFFGYLFIYSGSLLVVMILHFIVDAVGGLLTLKYVKEEEALSMDPDLINEKDPPGGPVI